MRLLPLALLTLLLAAPAAVAQQGSTYAGTIAPGDDDVSLALQTFLAPAGYVDANGNRQFDATAPDETMYLDLDNSHTVSFADLRMNGFLGYGAGSAVDFTNRDFGRDLIEPRGWFARDASQAWWFDADQSATISPGDLRVTGAGAGTKAQAGDAALGGALTVVQDTFTAAVRLGWNDANGNRVRDLTEPVYLDTNNDKQASPGELRISTLGLGLDNDVTRAEFEAALADLRSRDAGLAQEDQRLGTRVGAAEDGLAALANKIDNLGNWLMVLGLFTVVGLLAVAWYARKLASQQHATTPAEVAESEKALR